MRQTVATPLSDLSEKELTSQAVGTKSSPGLARTLGWLAYHTLRSKGSEPGFPDWTLVRDRVVFLELKTEHGKVSDAQRHWIGALLAAQAHAYIVRPADVQLLASVLAHRGRDDPPAHIELLARTRTEIAPPPASRQLAITV